MELVTYLDMSSVSNEVIIESEMRKLNELWLSISVYVKVIIGVDFCMMLQMTGQLILLVQFHTASQPSRPRYECRVTVYEMVLS
jgi:hypothetical protein